MNRKIFLIALLPLVVACTDMEDVETTAFVEEVNSLEVTYKGKTYNVLTTLDKDGNLVYLDTEFKKIYEEEISHFPNLATLALGENKIVYYPTQEEMLEELQLAPISDKDNSVNSRAERVLLGQVTLWDDTGYKDRSFTFQVYSMGAFINIPHLKPLYNFNDKTSALKVWSYIPKEEIPFPTHDFIMSGPKYCVVFYGYEHQNYSGKVLCCVPENSGPAHEHSRLKSIGWNDKITAISLKACLRTSSIKPHD